MNYNLNWLRRDEHEPTKPFMSMGWSNHVLVYSEENDYWFEAVYNYKDKRYYTIDTICLVKSKISHFCEEIPIPLKNEILTKK